MDQTAIDRIRKFFPEQLANEICSVQPMSEQIMVDLLKT
jgi:hypothetical protein